MKHQANHSMDRTNSPATRETRVIHDVHRRATTLLAELVARRSAPTEQVAAFRDFVVAMLEHHHNSEDRDLWPLIAARAPDLERPLRDLTDEHDHLQERLDELGADRFDGHGDDSAATVRDLLHVHLAHEEPVLFPALDHYVGDDEWDRFSERTVATAPQDGLHYLLALIHEVGSTADAELIFAHVPPEGRAAIPAGRAAGDLALRDLRSTLVSAARVR